MKKILFITDSFYEEMGGSFIAVASTFYELIKKNLNVKLVYFSNGRSNKSVKLYSIIKESDTVHYFGVWTYSHIKSFILSIILKKKIIITPMGAFEPWSLSQKKIKKRIALILYQKLILKKADLIHCTSTEEEQNIKKIDKNIKTVKIVHGLGGTKYEKKEVKNKKKKRMLFFSRIHKKKGLEKVIKAWSIIRPDNWEFDIIGPDGDNSGKDLKKLVLQNNLSDKIFFKDPIYLHHKKKEMFQNYDVSILFSKNENFGYSIIECLRHSLPVITNENVPWSEIRDYDAGWFIDDDFQTLLKTLKEVFQINDENLLLKSCNAFNLSKRYNWENLISRYEEMYENLN